MPLDRIYVRGFDPVDKIIAMLLPLITDHELLRIAHAVRHLVSARKPCDCAGHDRDATGVPTRRVDDAKSEIAGYPKSVKDSPKQKI